MKHINRIIPTAVLLAAVLGFSACGISMDKYSETVAATYGDQTISLQEANFLLRYQQWSEEAYASAMYEAYGIDNFWTMDSGIDSKTMGALLKETTMAQILQTKILNDHAEELGVTLSDADRETISSFVEKLHNPILYNPEFWNYTSATDEEITQWMEENAIAVRVNEKVLETAEIEVTDEECNEFTIEYFTIDAEPQEDTTEEEPETTINGTPLDMTIDAYGEELAQAVVDGLHGGATISQIEETYGLTHSDQSYLIHETDENITSSILYQEGSKLATGESVMVKNGEDGWYVIYCESDLDLIASAEKKESVEDSKRTEAFNTLYAEWAAAAPEFSVKKCWDDLQMNKIYVDPETEAETETAEAETAETSAES